jgi:hypothetical protein
MHKDHFAEKMHCNDVCYGPFLVGIQEYTMLLSEKTIQKYGTAYSSRRFILQKDSAKGNPDI